MMLGYVHNTTKVYRLWDFEQRRAIECSNVRWHEELNAFECEFVTGRHTTPSPEESIETIDPLMVFPEVEHPEYQSSDSEEESNVTTSMYNLKT